ncbi:hypothetical protein BRADI_2g22963v3 [Brachypodium distachyon]|uniref:DUF4005 domain-containing protein n=1 Tax=Brachypodium distachyon TaxID=15368 RepID=A0A2K2D9Z6_BRADI|nr:hypothetical protein BRADI_2g22963v3 [Brachypodium distachyon]
MGRKGRWFDAVQRILTTSEPDRDEKESKKAERPANKSNFRKIWQFSKSSPSNPSSSAAPETALPPSQPDHQQEAEEIREAESAGTTSEQISDGRYLVAEPASATATAVAAQATEAVASVVAVTPRAPVSSKEELAIVRIQTACRGYLARRGHQARGQARLMELMEGITVRRQTEEALYCMQTMTRVQTQINSRRAKTEEGKKALKSQIQQKQSLDKAKIGEGWDHSHQSKEQLEALQATKQEAASRRQRAMSYAFSRQWRNRPRNPSASGRGATTPMHDPTFMDPGCPNWGWSIAERSMAAARPWENQSAPQGKDRAPAKSAAGVRTAKPRVSISIQIPPPTTPPGSRSARPPPGWPSPSTPTRPRSPSVLGRAPSPRGSALHRSTSGLSERPRSSQEHLGSGSSSPIQGGKEQQQGPLSLRRTTSLRSGELPRLSLGARPDVDTSEAGGAPVTPSYMQPTKSVRAKAGGGASPAAGDRAAEFPPEKAPPVSSPSVKKRLPMEFAKKASVPPASPRKLKAAERAKRPSQPPSPRL